jgi:AcrR family transcriptional regulator
LAALVDTGIALLGDGEAPLTVRAVCRTSGVTERYFYETFADREDFVRRVYAEAGNRVQHVLIGAVSQARPSQVADAAIDAFVTMLTTSPAVVRVLLLTPFTEPSLGSQGISLAPTFVSLVQAQMTGIEDENQRYLIALGVVGALTTLFMAYLNGTVAMPREQFVRHCVLLVKRSALPFMDAQSRA